MQSSPEARHVQTVLVIRPVLPQDARLNGNDLLAIRRLSCSGGSSSSGIEYALELPEPPIPSNRSASKGSARSHTLAGGDKRQSLTFPKVYGFQAEDQRQLCPREIEPLLQGVWRGESAAVIAYGQTGSGKSYICGTESRLAPPWECSVGAYLARRIWELIQERDCADCHVECGMIEIYREGSGKELVSDLLGLFERGRLGNYNEHNYRWHAVNSPAELLSKLGEGSRLRATDTTDGNVRSSRSHGIFTVRVRRTETDPTSGRRQRISGRFLLVDLAGAEDASSAAVGSQQQRQGSGINVGLSTLQLVIKEIAEKGSTLHYRSSKLTHLLKPALGGEGNGMRTVLIGCVSPLTAHAARTRHTLSYLKQAGAIVNRVAPEVEALEARREAALLRERDAWRAKAEALAEELQSVKREMCSSMGGGGGGVDVEAAAGDAAGIEAPNVASSSKDGRKRAPARIQDLKQSSSSSDKEREMVILSSTEHTELLERLRSAEDRGQALEVIIKEADYRYIELQSALMDAETRAQRAETAAVLAANKLASSAHAGLRLSSDADRAEVSLTAPPVVAVGSLTPEITTESAAAPASRGTVDGGELPEWSVSTTNNPKGEGLVVDNSTISSTSSRSSDSNNSNNNNNDDDESTLTAAALQTPRSAAIAASPAMTAVMVSPVLAAAQGVGVGAWQGVDGAAGDKRNNNNSNEIKLDVDDICLTAEESHLKPEQYQVLRRLVASRLAQMGHANDAAACNGEGEGGDSTGASRAEIAGLRLAVGAYNECLGALANELEKAAGMEAELRATILQAAKEKMTYVDLTAKYNAALDLSQSDVMQLQAELKDARRASSAIGGGAHSSPGKILSRLLNRSPAPGETAAIKTTAGQSHETAATHIRGTSTPPPPAPHRSGESTPAAGSPASSLPSRIAAWGAMLRGSSATASSTPTAQSPRRAASGSSTRANVAASNATRKEDVASRNAYDAMMSPPARTTTAVIIPSSRLSREKESTHVVKAAVDAAFHPARHANDDANETAAHTDVHRQDVSASALVAAFPLPATELVDSDDDDDGSFNTAGDMSASEDAMPAAFPTSNDDDGGHYGVANARACSDNDDVSTETKLLTTTNQSIFKEAADSVTAPSSSPCTSSLTEDSEAMVEHATRPRQDKNTRRLLSNAVVPTTRKEERVVVKAMNGGVDASALASLASRRGASALGNGGEGDASARGNKAQHWKSGTSQGSTRQMWYG